MSELMEKILADKLVERKRLVSLPFEEKLTLMEKMRDRTLLIQRPTVVMVSGDGVVLEEADVHKMGVMPLASHQLQDQSNIRQNSVTLIARLLKQPARWQLDPMVEAGCEPEFEFR